MTHFKGQKENLPAMEDFDELTQSSETASDYGRSPCLNYEAILKLIERLSLECKDSGSLLKIQNAIHSYQRLTQLKTGHCRVLRRKLQAVENELSGLHKKLADAEHEQLKQEQELCNVRFTLKQEEEKRKNVVWVYDKMKEQLREKEEQYDKEVKMKQKLELRVRELDVELKTVRNDLDKVLEERNSIKRQLLQEQNTRVLQDEILANHLHKQKELKITQEKISSQLQEALEQHIQPAQCSEKMHDYIQKLGLENLKLKATARKQAEKIEQLKKNLLNEFLSDDLTEKLETTSAKCQHLYKQNQLLWRELLSMKTIQRKCEKLKKHKKKLEQEVVSLRSHMEKNMIECDQIEQYKWEIEEKTKQELVEKLKQVNLFLQTQAAYEDKLEKLRHKQNASVRTQMELRIRDLESEFSKMRSQVDCNQIEMENYKQLYLEEVKIRKSLSNKLSKTDERLAEVKTKLLMERKQNRASQYSMVDTRPVLESTCPRDSNKFFIPRSFSGENMLPTSNLWHSVETKENCKTKVLQEWEQSVTRELRQERSFSDGC
ncbi:ankyrin repeat domain-containing protein 26-like [Mastomys coucha]|uniref:ankyrin repeat domain-containing protein 26-like n=1 Tax=Mastomys coucha TaxID=35658 RepID=UPI0012621FB8|nr:ankyrin repeat domain-containing protein 26-like [Mastomys coucha]XP_031232478.1 ankyrin repeat domain-containing protein 26-like [Mastomys coucha]XP_031232479.1 ankyrin repeat domain-containing protein 26-like [Mastomys coucha]XP_031232480.1 ankyrin repeat domain-containing protein 26-like [Mastomys coucha]